MTAVFPTSSVAYGVGGFHKTNDLGSTTVPSAIASTTPATITVSDATTLTTWPTASFVVLIQGPAGGDPTELKFITSRSGNVLTVGTNGFGGTGASTHPAGATIKVVATAELFAQITDEIIAVEGFLIGTDFHYDSTNHRIGIGTATPTSTLHVVGTATISGALTLGSTITIGGVTYTFPASAPADTTKFLGVSATSGATATLAWLTPAGSGASQWTTSGSAIFYNAGSVVIGTSTVAGAKTLDVTGTLHVTGTATFDGSGSFGGSVTVLGSNLSLASGATFTVGGLQYTWPGSASVGQVLTVSAVASLAITLAWATPSGGTSQWTTTGSNIYYNTGNVGIGDSSPLDKLSILAASAASAGISARVKNTTTTGYSNFVAIADGGTGNFSHGIYNSAVSVAAYRNQGFLSWVDPAGAQSGVYLWPNTRPTATGLALAISAVDNTNNVYMMSWQTVMTQATADGRYLQLTGGHVTGTLYPDGGLRMPNSQPLLGANAAGTAGLAIGAIDGSNNTNLGNTSNITYISSSSTPQWFDGVTFRVLVDTTRSISAGTGLTGGGDFSTNRTLSIASSGVTAGSYTNANITVDSTGRITSASNGAASGAATGTVTSSGGIYAGTNNGTGPFVSLNGVGGGISIVTENGNAIEFVARGYALVASFAFISGGGYKLLFPASGANKGIDMAGWNTIYNITNPVSNGDAVSLSWFNTHAAGSDVRLKENVRTITDALALVRRLRGVRFSWGSRAASGGLEVGRPQVGLIAQEVETVIPEATFRRDWADLESVGHVEYGHLVGVLVEAIKDLAGQVEELRGPKA